MGTIIQDARTALSTQITNAGLTCLKYQEDRIPTQLPCADLWLQSVGVDDRYDQKYGFGKLEFLLTVYQHAGPRAQKAQQYQDANILTVLTALGADRTLNGVVTDSEITGARTYHARTERSGAGYIVTEMTIVVTPRPNVA